MMKIHSPTFLTIFLSRRTLMVSSSITHSLASSQSTYERHHMPPAILYPSKRIPTPAQRALASFNETMVSFNIIVFLIDMPIEVALCSMSSWTVGTLEWLSVTSGVVTDLVSGTNEVKRSGSYL